MRVAGTARTCTGSRSTWSLAALSTSNRSSPTGSFRARDCATRERNDTNGVFRSLENSYTFKEAKEAFEANTKGVGKDGNAVIKIIIAGPVETDTA
jgi:hypothetical protein